MVFLEGGFWCWDEPTCAGRFKYSPQLMSSKTWPSTVNYGGMLSQNASVNPTFADANQVYLPYCSSDTFSGDREASPETHGWVFRGKTILAVLVEELAKLGMTDATDVVLAGCSAGEVHVLMADCGGGEDVLGNHNCYGFLQHYTLRPSPQVHKALLSTWTTLQSLSRVSPMRLWLALLMLAG